MNQLMKFNKYFFLFAHPDDEVYCSALINRLVKSDKKITIAYATSGDAGGRPGERQKEVLGASKIIGLKKNNINFLQIKERELLKNLKRVVKSSLNIIKNQDVDCIIGQDYEGGHEGHDAVSFCASEVAKLANIINYFVFPVYHGKPQERKGARFKPQRKKYLTLKLTKAEKTLKRKILDAHTSQKEHFDGLQKSSDNYYDLLFSREVYFEITEKIKFLQKPTPEVGYEFHRNGFKYDDFKKSIKKYKDNLLL